MFLTLKTLMSGISIKTYLIIAAVIGIIAFIAYIHFNSKHIAALNQEIGAAGVITTTVVKANNVLAKQVSNDVVTRQQIITSMYDNENQINTANAKIDKITTDKNTAIKNIREATNTDSNTTNAAVIKEVSTVQINTIWQTYCLAVSTCKQ